MEVTVEVLEGLEALGTVVCMVQGLLVEEFHTVRVVE